MTERPLSDGWQRVKFGDIAKHISKRVKPSETDLEVYIGLEHLNTNSLKIKRHGVPSDVEGQKLLVKKGQIIFCKRRAYLRKVAVSDWDCMCSHHAMVLKANPEYVISDFLPFFMQSDVFMNRAISVSSGSLSPTISRFIAFNGYNTVTIALCMFNDYINEIQSHLIDRRFHTLYYVGTHQLRSQNRYLVLSPLNESDYRRFL